MQSIRIDLDGVFPKECGAAAGLDAGAFDPLVRLLEDPVQLEAIRSDSGFLDLERRAPDWLDAVEMARPGVPFDDLVVLGIGGSALGTRAALTALGAPAVRVHVVDNVDPHTLRTTLSGLDPVRTVLNVVSKSGGTLETAAGFLVALDWLRRALPAEEVRRRIVATTDPQKGFLRPWAAREGWKTLAVPPDIGGRYSVLTPVGLFPLVMAGLDGAALLAGAVAALQGDGVRSAARLAAALHLLDTARGRHVHVVWPYGDRLVDLGAWFLQLWAESLGKQREDGVATGPTPVLVRGTTDQHSQLQLYMEGPADKAFVFLAVEDPGEDLEVTAPPGLPEQLAYLAGRSLGELLDVCRRATTRALLDAGRPCAAIHLPRLDEAALGGAFQLMMTATALAGTAYGINPFDQPGVEAGKRHARALLDRTRPL